MRTIAVVSLVGVICLAGGFFAGSATCHRSHVASAQAALRRATEAALTLQVAPDPEPFDPDAYFDWMLGGMK